MNRLLTNTEIESVIKKFQNPGPQSFTVEFYQTYNEFKLFRKCEEEQTPPNSFYEATITLMIPKPDRHYKKRKLQINIPDIYRCKNSQCQQNECFAKMNAC